LINITIDGDDLEVEDGTTVAAAILGAGHALLRRSVTGEARGPLCGMGICFECRVTIDGVAHQRSCNLIASDGMHITTDG
jgi:predicted molibdopterin-dependent oxidoreductase YjgC